MNFMNLREALSNLSIRKSSFKAKGNINVNASTTINHYGDQPSSAPDPTTLLLQEHVTFRAFYDSKNRFDPPRCHLETRTAILKTIDLWARDRSIESKPIMWLNGAAGAGKSAIAQTSIETWTSDGLTAIGFFFWRTDDQRNQKSYLIPTLAYQLMKLLPAAKAEFRKAIGDGDIFQRTLKSQVELLIVNPLKSLLSKKPKTVVIVIDGLDECCIDLPKTDDFPGQDHESQQAEILEAIALACQHIPSLRVLIASRPDHRIRLSFESQSFVGGFLKERSIPLSLNRVNADDDILLFLEFKFVEIRAEYRGIPTSWPSDEQLSQLVRNSSGCFIYPSTVVRYILRRGKAPSESLEMILGLRPNTDQQDNPFAELDALYQYILRSVPAHSIGTVRDVLGRICFQHIVDGALFPKAFRRFIMPDIFVVSIHPQSPPFFQELLFLAPGEIFNHLTDLHAILDIPDPEDREQEHQEITFLHATFSQYLQDEGRSGEFLIRKTEYQCRLLNIYESHIQRAVLQLSEADAIDGGTVDKANSIYHFSGLINSFISLSENHIGKNYQLGKDTLAALWAAVGHFTNWYPAGCEMRVGSNLFNGYRGSAIRQETLGYLKNHLERMEWLPEEVVVAQQRLEEAIQSTAREIQESKLALWINDGNSVADNN